MGKKKFLNQNLKQFRIAIYTRVSTEEQAVNPEGSIKNQEERIREFIKLKNAVESFGEVVQIFSDPGRSAKDMNRPGFQKMLQAIRNQEINMVVVTELSRFSRSTKDFAILQEFLDEHNCKFLSLRENFDTSGAAGSMVMNLMATIAEFERRQTAERISNSFLARSKRGLYNGGSVPLGYRIDKNRPGYLIIDPDEAEIVRTAFRAFLKHETLAVTAKYLTSIGIIPPQKVHGSGARREKNFTIDSLYRLLRNKAYISVRVFQSKNGQEEVPAVWEPIIDRALFEKAGKILSKNCHHKRSHGENRFPYTLSGLIFCSQCNESMSGKSAHGRGGKVGYYEHIKVARMQSGNPLKIPIHNPHRVPSAKLEPLVWQEVKRFIQNDSFVQDLLSYAEALNLNPRETTDREIVQKKINILENQIELLAERMSTLPKELDLKPFIDQMSKLQKNKVDLEEGLKTLSVVKPSLDLPVDFSDLNSFRKVLRKMIEKAEIDLSLQSSLIKKVIHKIIIKPKGFEIHFHIGESHYAPKILENPAKQSQNLRFFKNPGSSLLTTGDPTPT